MGKICFIGAGAMAEAIIGGMIKKEFISSNQIMVTNKSDHQRLNQIAEQYHVLVTSEKEEAIMGADMVILATKPYDLSAALVSIEPYIQTSQLVISVVAGKSTQFIAEYLKEGVPIVRTMPNTSATIGYSATAITKGKAASKKDVMMTRELFETIGIAVIVEESDMHIVTSISGSGPAYLYYLAEVMCQTAIDMGLDKGVADTLIAQTMLGAGKMLQKAGIPAEGLRKNITSPGGTTESGIKVLENGRFQEIVKQCITAARKRSIELGEEF